MRNLLALATAMLGGCLLLPATSCVAQAAPVNAYQQQNGDWQNGDQQQDRDHQYDQNQDRDHDHDFDRDRDRQNYGMPQGSYVSSCRDLHMNGDRLEATCEKRNGEWRNTSLDDVQRCDGNVVNDNGHLKCVR